MNNNIKNTFKVSDIKINNQPQSKIDLLNSFESLVKIKPEACGSNKDNLIKTHMHPFINAAYTAFQHHYPLVLSPDDVWLCIAQGFANHVNANAESLRKQFVQHEGKEIIRIECPDFVKGSDKNSWENVFPQFSDRIAEHIGKKRDLIVSDFSTTNQIEKIASEIVLMDAMKQYFDYRCRTCCGIPEITLLGTTEDWLNIKCRAACFAEFGLQWWIEALNPILDKLIQTSKSIIDVDFWKSFFKEGGGSGGPFVTGWINTLFPYLKKDKKNKYVESWQDRNRFCAGPNTDDFTIGLSQVPFIWEYYGQNLQMQFLGGFVGLSQDNESCAISPAIGWAVSDVNYFSP